MTDQVADTAEERDQPSVADVGDASRADLPRWRRGTLLRDGYRLHWYKEFGIVLSVYLFYETIRNLSKGRPSVAFDHALQVIGWQKALGINHEKAIQDWALHYKPLIIASNYYYGIAYIAGTIGILLWLYRRQSNDYPLWRNTLLIGTVLGLIGFATYPAHAAAPARRVGLRPPDLRLRRHAGEVPDVLVVRLSDDEVGLEPVRRHAEPALWLGVVGRGRGSASGQDVVGEGSRDQLPGLHHLRGRRHRATTTSSTPSAAP